MKSSFKCQEMMATQKEINQIFHSIKNYCKLIGIDLSRKTNTNIPQKINFTGKLEEDDGTRMFFTAESQQKTDLIFC